jgi:hypothetical protein
LLRESRAVAFGEREDDVIETRTLAVERIPDGQGKLVRQWLNELCIAKGSPFAIGLLSDSIAVLSPRIDHRLHAVDVKVCAGELSAVTG